MKNSSFNTTYCAADVNLCLYCVLCNTFFVTYFCTNFVQFDENIRQ